jgi:hypothetical protein
MASILQPHSAVGSSPHLHTRFPNCPTLPHPSSTSRLDSIRRGIYLCTCFPYLARVFASPPRRSSRCFPPVRYPSLSAERHVRSSLLSGSHVRVRLHASLGALSRNLPISNSEILKIWTSTTQELADILENRSLHWDTPPSCPIVRRAI